MSKELSNLFKEKSVTESQNFNSIKISLQVQRKLNRGRMEKSKNLKR